jgi:hypothetical protein
VYLCLFGIVDFLLVHFLVQSTNKNHLSKIIKKILLLNHVYRGIGNLLQAEFEDPGKKYCMPAKLRRDFVSIVEKIAPIPPRSYFFFLVARGWQPWLRYFRSFRARKPF